MRTCAAAGCSLTAHGLPFAFGIFLQTRKSAFSERQFMPLVLYLGTYLGMLLHRL